MPRGRPKGSAASYGVRIQGPMSAYAFFIKSSKDKIKKFKAEDYAKLATKCAMKWKLMSEKDKEKFHKLAAADRKRYEEEMKDYIPPPGAGSHRIGRCRKNKDPLKPKRALSAFFFFAKDERPKILSQNPDFSIGEVAKEIGRKWNEMPEETKAPYEVLADKDRTRYNVEMKAYRASGGGRNRPPVKKGVRTDNGTIWIKTCTDTGRRKRKGGKERDTNKPKRALPAFFYFARDERPRILAKHPEYSVGECAKELGRKWNEISEGRKAPYERAAEEDRVRYNRDMKIYRKTGVAPPPTTILVKDGNNGKPIPLVDISDDEQENDESNKSSVVNDSNAEVDNIAGVNSSQLNNSTDVPDITQSDDKLTEEGNSNREFSRKAEDLRTKQEQSVVEMTDISNKENDFVKSDNFQSNEILTSNMNENINTVECTAEKKCSNEIPTPQEITSCESENIPSSLIENQSETEKMISS